MAADPHRVELRSVGSPPVPPAQPSIWRWAMGLVDDIVTAARRRPRIAVGVPLLGAVIGVVLALLIPPRYPASASFVTESDNMRLPINAGLAGLASQLGVAGSKGDSPQFYADMLRNRTILLPLLERRYPPSVTGRSDSASLATLLGIKEATTPLGRDAALRVLDRRMTVNVNPRTNVVNFVVEARTPQLAVALTNDVLSALNAFNLRLRQSRAAAQRRFIEDRVEQAAQELRAAEDELRRFLTSNRLYAGSPSLQFEEARLRRSVDLRQTLYTGLRQQLDQATVDEARNTPSLTVVTEPVLITKKSFPPRRLIVALALGLALALTVITLRVVESSAFRTRVDDPRSWHGQPGRLAAPIDGARGRIDSTH
jgi:uncharacterized protein involved in exopolysaccharide biosynthesis